LIAPTSEQIKTKQIKMVFHNFEGNLPRIPITFYRKGGEKYFVNNALLDSGASAIAIIKDVYDFLGVEPSEAKKADTAAGKKDAFKISDVTFVLGDEKQNVKYIKEKIYYSPNAIHISIGIHPIFDDFDVSIKTGIKTIILELSKKI
jgi:predicted aspartyl protease